MLRSQIDRQRSSSTTRRRICECSDLKDGFLGKSQVPTKPVLDKIGKIYGGVRAKFRKESLHNGFCFGLLDPASNIVANNDMAPLGEEEEEVGRDMMIQRSLDGLVAFLTYLFPYLPEAEATAYLDAAKADPLVAAHLVVIRRGLRDSYICSNAAAVETALRCAAAAARHPCDPELLVLGWRRLSPGLQKLASRLSRTRPDYAAALHTMNRLKAAAMTTAPVKRVDVQVSWDLARERLSRLYPLGRELPPARAAMKRILLAKIHGFYLKALGCLPTHELRSTYHGSMLRGGYCYGPLDPVSNIIVNTVWYEQNFSIDKHHTVEMISTNCLWRAATRSLYGLVSFLCTRYKLLTPDLAMQRLLVAELDLRVADPNLLVTPPQSSHATGGSKLKKLDWSGGLQIGSGECSTFEMQFTAADACAPSATVVEAYGAAATAAFHPDPLAHQEFLGSSGVPVQLLIYSEFMPIKVDCLLSVENLKFLSMAISKSASSVDKRHQQQEPVPKELRSVPNREATRENRFFGQLQRVRRMVESALDTFNSNNPADPPFRLHVICGVNELVSGPEFSKDPSVRGYNPYTPHKYYHSHINFLAVPEGQQNSSATLFFAEGNNHGSGDCWCVPVKTYDPLAVQVRCFYCEVRGSRIVHASQQHFCGLDIEYEKILRGESLFFGTDKYNNDNDAIIFKTRNVDWVYGVDDDAIYVNYRHAAVADGGVASAAKRSLLNRVACN